MRRLPRRLGRASSRPGARWRRRSALRARRRGHERHGGAGLRRALAHGRDRPRCAGALTTTARRRRLRPARPRRRATSRRPSSRFRARVRYDADYGIGRRRGGPQQPGALRAGPVAGAGRPHVRATSRAAGSCTGWLGFKLGRQYVTDALGWWSFDGGEVSAHDAVLREGRGLRRPRGARRACRSAPRASRRDGVWRGDRTGYDPIALPAVPAGRRSRRPSASRSSPRA